MFRLKSVYIKDYKNIHEQTFDFSGNTGYIALIGLNGSGKSNLLEAISIIFDDLYSIPRQINTIGEYEIVYEIDGTLYTYSTVDERKNSIPRSYPSSVIACYSGEDLRMWDMAYRPYYMNFFYAALHGGDYVPQNMYVNKYCWKIALISLLFSLNRETQQFVHDTLQIDPNNITIQFTYKEIQNPQPHDAYNWLDRVKQNFGTNKIPLADLRDFGLGNLKHTEMTEDKLIFYYLYLLYMPSKSPRQPIDKLISNISIELGGFEFDSLSEGEKKMILIGCITQVLGDDNSLVLLDEPDAHVHIENKKKILDTIAQYNGQTILTTHSPIFTNLMTNNNIFPIEGGQLMSKEKQDLITSISSNEIDIINGACVVNSKYIIITEGSTDIRYIQQAIKALRTNNPRLDQFDKVAFLPQGSADHTESFYNDIVSKLPNTVISILYLFDHDQAGLINSQKIQAKPKVQYLFYQPNYNTPYTSTYYIEDFFPEGIYGKQLNIANIPQPLSPNMHYHQIREIVSAIQDQKKLADTIKKNIERSAKRFNANNYTDFLPLLLEILNKFGL